MNENGLITAPPLIVPTPRLPKGVYGSATLGKLFEALAKAQAEFGIAVFDSKNPHFKNEFASLRSIDEATKKQLTKVGIAVTQVAFTDENGGQCLFTMLGHSSGEYLAGTVKLFLSKQDMQGLGASLTYAKRYSKAAVIGVVSDADDDGEASVGRGNPTQPEALQSQFTGEGERDDRLVTEAQAKMIYAKAKAKKIPDEKLKDILLQVSGVRSTAQVPWGDVNTILNEIASFGSH